MCWFACTASARAQRNAWPAASPWLRRHSVHSGWDEEAGFSALYLKVPERDFTLILLTNGEGLPVGSPLDEAAVKRSRFARAFLHQFVFGEQNGDE